jgi:PhnB protein
MPVQPVPEGYHTVTPYLAVEDAQEAIDFYGRALGATERSRMPGPENTIAHAELEIGDSLVMLSDPFPQASTKTPKELGGTSVNIFLYVDNVDDFVQKALDAGATLTAPVEDQFWGDRFGVVTDPFGHTWSVATHVEDVAPEEIAERAKTAMAGMASS